MDLGKMWEWLKWIKHGFFLKGCAGEKKREWGKEKKLCLVTGTCCVAIVGGWCVNRATNCVVFFRPEVSFKQARKSEMYLSRAPLAASPWLYCSNVNGGLGDVGWDPLHPSPATAPLLLFSIKTAGIFQRVLARWLMCNSSQPHLPPRSVIHRPGSRRCFLLSTLFPGEWVESLLHRFLSLSHYLFLTLFPVNHHYIFLFFFGHGVTTSLHSFLLTQFVQLQIAPLSASNYRRATN